MQPSSTYLIHKLEGFTMKSTDLHILTASGGDAPTKPKDKGTKQPASTPKKK